MIALRQTESRPHQTGTQKKGVIWKRTRQSNRDQQDPKQRQFKQADKRNVGVGGESSPEGGSPSVGDWRTRRAAAGEIQLKYREGVRLLYVEPGELHLLPTWAAETARTNKGREAED